MQAETASTPIKETLQKEKPKAPASIYSVPAECFSLHCSSVFKTLKKPAETRANLFHLGEKLEPVIVGAGPLPTYWTSPYGDSNAPNSRTASAFASSAPPIFSPPHGNRLRPGKHNRTIEFLDLNQPPDRAFY